MKEIVYIDQYIVVVTYFLFWKFVNQLIIAFVDLCKWIYYFIELNSRSIHYLHYFLYAVWYRFMQSLDPTIVRACALHVASQFVSYWYFYLSTLVLYALDSLSKS